MMPGQVTDGLDRDVGRHEKEPAVGILRDKVFFNQQLQTVGDRLQKPPRPHTHWTQPTLNESRDLSFQISCISNPERRDRHHRAHLDERPDDVVHRLLAEELQQQAVDEVEWC